jgi:ligand-binding sensor protein
MSRPNFDVFGTGRACRAKVRNPLDTTTLPLIRQKKPGGTKAMNKAIKMTDISPREDWVHLEKDVNEKFGLNAAVFENDGTRVTTYVNWGNPVCPLIKGNPKGQRYICAVAHQNLAGQAAQTKKPVIGECDAGLVKIAVPVFVGDDLVGIAGGCGSIMSGAEVESFFVNQTTDIDEDEIKKRSQDIKAMTKTEAEAVVAFIQKRVDAMVKDFETRTNA